MPDLSYTELKKLLDDTTALLCAACGLMVKHKVPFKTNQPLKNWWTKHQIMDEDRTRREALKKLNPEERRVLGLR